jgi:hypothetical protein
MTDNPDSTSEWLVSLRIVMSHVERSLAGGGRGAYIFVLTPLSGARPEPAAGGASAPPPEGRSTPAGE